MALSPDVTGISFRAGHPSRGRLTLLESMESPVDPAVILQPQEDDQRAERSEQAGDISVEV